MKKALQVLIVLAIVLVPVNDLGRYLKAQYELGNATTELAQKAAETAQRTQGTREQVGALVAQNALSEGMELYAYDQDLTYVTVYTRLAVPGMILTPRVLAWKNKQPANTPLYVKSQAKRTIR